MMMKSLIQVGLLAALLIGAAAMEAAVPIFKDGQQDPEYGYITNSRDYGTLKGWQKCINKGSGKTTSATRERCTQYLAKLYEAPSIELEIVGFMPGEKCGRASHGRLTRAVQATISNRSEYSYFFSLEVDAENDTAHAVGGSGKVDIQLAPGASKQVCFTAFAFENTGKLDAFLPHEHLSEFEVRHASGIEYNVSPVDTLLARLF